MDNSTSEVTDGALKTLNIAVDSEKMTPKYCTATNIKKLGNGNVVLSFYYFIKNEEAPGSIIESILIDKDHAQRIVDALKNVIDTPIPSEETNVPNQ